MSVTLVIDEALLLISLGQDPDWRLLGMNWVARARAECPRGKERGGSLAGSMVVRFGGGGLPTIEVGSELTRDHGVSALGLVHEGTAAHPIVGKNSPRKMLRFKSGGTTVFRHRVEHPGTHPNRFVERACQQAIVMSGGSAFTG